MHACNPENEATRRETERNGAKRNETKRNKTKQNELNRIESNGMETRLCVPKIANSQIFFPERVWVCVLYCAELN